jgi:hypothetical protein
MSIDPSKFRAASEACEDWLNIVSFISHFGPSGAVDQLYPLLMPTEATKRTNLQTSYNEHAALLDQLKDSLAVVSDGPVKWEHGRGWSGIARVPAGVYPHVWSSAHEAAEGIARMALDMLTRPLEGITDPAEQYTEAKRVLAARWKAMAISLEEVADLQERIRRERAKLLALHTTTGINVNQKTEQPDDDLPWDGGDDWDDLAPLPRRLLQYMRNKQQAEVTDVIDCVWGKDPADVKDGSIHAAIHKANAFLGRRPSASFLEKPRGESIIRWR